MTERKSSFKDYPDTKRTTKLKEYKKDRYGAIYLKNNLANFARLNSLEETKNENFTK